MSSFNGFKEVTEKLDAIDFNPYKKIGTRAAGTQ